MYCSAYHIAWSTKSETVVTESIISYFVWQEMSAVLSAHCNSLFFKFVSPSRFQSSLCFSLSVDISGSDLVSHASPSGNERHPNRTVGIILGRGTRHIECMLSLFRFSTSELLCIEQLWCGSYCRTYLAILLLHPSICSPCKASNLLSSMKGKGATSSATVNNRSYNDQSPDVIMLLCCPLSFPSSPIRLAF